MIPVDKVRDIISKHKLLEKELSSDKVDKKKFAKISKEYSDLNEILNDAKQYLSFDKTERELNKLIDDSETDQEMRELAKVELDALNKNIKIHEKKLKSNVNHVYHDSSLHRNTDIRTHTSVAIKQYQFVTLFWPATTFYSVKPLRQVSSDYFFSVSRMFLFKKYLILRLQRIVDISRTRT